MNESSPDDRIGPVLLTSKIIMGSLLMGLLSFLAIVLFLGMNAPAGPRPNAPPPQSLIPLTPIAFLLAVPCLIASVLVPRLIVKATRRRIAKGTWKPPLGTNELAPEPLPPGPEGERLALALLYQNQMIVGAALNEGAAFFALIVFFLEHNPLALGLALALIAAQAVRFPLRDRVERWLDRQQEQIAQERQFAD